MKDADQNAQGAPDTPFTECCAAGTESDAPLDAGVRADLLRRINADLQPQMDWRAGALTYVRAERAKWGADVYDGYMLAKPMAPVSADAGVFEAQIAENAAYLYNFVNALVLLRLPGGSAVLDVACGSAWLAQAFARMNYDACGFDVSSDMIALARRRFREDPLLAPLVGELDQRLIVLDIEQQALPAAWIGKFDAILLESCLHHFLNPVRALTHLAAGLSPKGLLLILEGENRRGPLKPQYQAVMREFATLERPLSRCELEAALDFAGLRYRRFLGRVNGFVAPDDPRLSALPTVVRADADALNYVLCAASEDALRRALPHAAS